MNCDIATSNARTAPVRADRVDPVFAIGATLDDHGSRPWTKIDEGELGRPVPQAVDQGGHVLWQPRPASIGVEIAEPAVEDDTTLVWTGRRP